MNRRSATVATCALACLMISILAGTLAALYYVPSTYPFLKSMGMSLQHFRPLHTVFAGAWIFLAAVSVVYFFLSQKDHLRFSPQDLWRYRLQMILWGMAGLSCLITIALGLFSGREYLGYHPSISFLILSGWLLFTWTFFGKMRKNFWEQPVYIYMWGAASLIFIYTFLEAHSWLLPSISKHPVVDLQLQWKSAGLLVGSFNLFVYGALAYLTEQLSGDKKSAHSKWVFALFWLGLLNSFTNYTHHTYHLPQRELVKWIGFLISMTEGLILLKVIVDLLSLYYRHRKTKTKSDSILIFVNSAKWWTCFNLALAILISIPPINTLIHGTHVVFAHAMGSMIGIDTMILLGMLSYMLKIFIGTPSPTNTLWIRRLSLGINISLAALILIMCSAGLTTGVSRYLERDLPLWLEKIPYYFASTGLILALCLGSLAFIWFRALIPLTIGFLKKTPSSVTSSVSKAHL